MNSNIKHELNSVINEIETLIKRGSYQDAYNLCKKILLNFPDHHKLIRLKNKIEKIVYKHNVAAVKKDLITLKPLWKQKKYEELVKKLTAAVQYVPGYKKAKKLLYRAQKAYRNQVSEMQKQTLDNYLRAIEQAIKTQDYEKAISFSREILRKIPQHEKCGSLYLKAKNLLVEQKIKENEKLLNSEKFNDIENFLRELEKICPESVRIKNLLKKAARREKITLEFAKKEFIYGAYDQLLILFQKGKYEKCIEGLREVLEIEPDNLKALEMLKKAEQKFSSQLDKEVTAKIHNLQKKFRLEKKKYPKDFIML
ncbi:hypothetical protein JW911_00745 [Candidatus Peregrinibacteria bacterium]|nr:hypothetical protein [Candidatus Peregrinibacteria bacterium]